MFYEIGCSESTGFASVRYVPNLQVHLDALREENRAQTAAEFSTACERDGADLSRDLYAIGADLSLIANELSPVLAKVDAIFESIAQSRNA
ncbi:MAG: hypothetical protein OXR66_02250 [Candidatus Woesearchaeota archaeon]|nr:hypothetical protein [Candidatus Woesearchaeota archaeon]